MNYKFTRWRMMSNYYPVSDLNAKSPPTPYDLIIIGLFDGVLWGHTHIP